MSIDKPFVLASVAMSLDGYIDDSTPNRLLLSNDDDFKRVDLVRASCDAILVGATTIKRDNPRLLIRDQLNREARVHRGKPTHPAKVTITSTGDLDPGSRFFSTGENEKIVYATCDAADHCRQRLDHLATIVDIGASGDLYHVLADLRQRGIQRLMVEGGTNIHSQFLYNNLVDELHVVIAPFFVGDENAPRFVLPGATPRGYPYNPTNHMTLAGTVTMDDVVLLRYVSSH